MAFARKTCLGSQTGICLTEDGKLVNYSRSNDYHFLEADKPEGLKMRMQRLHWVMPILEGRARGKIWMNDDGNKRVYFYQPEMYVVILNYNKIGCLVLNTAYRITEYYMRIKMETMFAAEIAKAKAKLIK